MKFFACFMFVIVVVVAVMQVAEGRPQVEHGSPNGPSGRFEKTASQASPPVDLSKPPVLLPEATPIEEAPQELVAAHSHVTHNEVEVSKA